MYRARLDSNRIHVELEGKIIFFTVTVSNAFAERGFSTLGRVNAYSRSRVNQEHLRHLVVLQAPKELTDDIVFLKLAKSFVNLKVNEASICLFGH